MVSPDVDYSNFKLLQRGVSHLGALSFSCIGHPGDGVQEAVNRAVLRPERGHLL